MKKREITYNIFFTNYDKLDNFNLEELGRILKMNKKCCHCGKQMGAYAYQNRKYHRYGPGGPYKIDFIEFYTYPLYCFECEKKKQLILKNITPVLEYKK